ncbi:MAG: Pseudouridine synthase [Gammaproteobacteria bacterium]|nr:Pseudouridine synthase [Gammaproteobacteria bacterium]
MAGRPRPRHLPVKQKKSAPERLQKILARAGLGSRREIETWIEAGRITVNGKIASLGDRVTTDDRIKVDKTEIKLAGSLPVTTQVLAYYKPEGEIVTRKDPEGRKMVYAALPPLKRGKWTAVGRLDVNSSGLLLFTTDGGLANRLMHPSANLEREYAVRILGEASPEQLNNMLRGVQLEDGHARFTSIINAGGRGVNHWYHVVLMEGRNREVRRLWESQGLQVSRLIRVRFGPYQLPRKKRTGHFWELTQAEVNGLLAAAGLKKQLTVDSKKLTVKSGMSKAKRQKVKSGKYKVKS